MTPTGSDDSGSEHCSNIEEIVKRIKWMKKEVDEIRAMVLYVREARDAMPLSTAGSLWKKWESAMTRCMESSRR